MFISDTAARFQLARHIRKEYDTQRNAAEHWGVSEQFVLQIVRGEKIIPKNIMKEIGLSECVKEVRIRYKIET